MNFDELVKTRRSVRQYLPDEVPDDLINKLLEAARWAPSGGNCQPWHFYVVKNKDIRRKLKEKSYPADWFLQAPIVIVVCTNAAMSAQRYLERGRDLYCIQDTAAAIQNILLSAKDSGLGTCWIGAFDEDACKEILNMDKNLRPVAMITVGYAAEEPTARARRPIGEIATFL